MNNFTRKGLIIFSFLCLAVSAWAQEPTNYPAGFVAATQSGTSVQLTWTGSIGANLPSNYLILVRVVPGGTITAPTDAAAVADDNDLSDDLGAVNVAHAVGANSYTWTGLPIDTDFEFVIYPYKTGGATDPDFKVPPPAAPSAMASTKRPTVTTPTVTDANETTATLGGTVTSNGGNVLTERGTVWKVGSGVTIANNKVAEGGTGVSTFTQARTGITPGSQIFYAAYATNVAGTTLSPESSFFTFSTVPDNHPTVTVAGTGFSTASITFTAINVNGANVDGYIILRRAGADPEISSVQNGVAPGSLVTGTSVLVAVITAPLQTVHNDTGLNPDVTYHYAVVPFSWNGVNSETYNYKVGTFSIDSDATFSSTSRIVLNGSTNATIAYRNRQATTIDNTDLSKSVRIVNYQIDDGGAANDADTQPTTLTSITISISNSSMVRKVALFSENGAVGDPQEIAGTEQDAAPTVTFAVNLPTPADNGTYNFMVRATFQAVVTDNTPIQVAITSVTAAPNGSGFAAIGTWPSTTTPLTENIIIVDATKYIFIPGTPPSGGIGIPLGGLTVRAVDGLNNRDLDFTGQQVDLTLEGGAGTLSLTPNVPSPILSAGQYNWTSIAVMGSGGTYTLRATDDDTGNPLDTDAVSGSFVISSGSVNINQPAVLDLCAGGNYKGFPAADANIIITEADNSTFSTPGGTLQLALPSGFNFDQTVTTAPIVAGGDISAPSVLSYPAANVVQFSYTIGGTANINSITIAGLKVRYTGPTGSPVAGSITRFGGTATIAGDNIGTVHAIVNFVPKTPPPGLGFTVTALPGDVTIVDPNETNFSSTGNAVQLNGTPGPPGVSFSGASVTSVAGSYRFNPSTLAPGTYPITFTYTEQTPEACQFTFTKNFNVYSSGINNLATVYCTNDPVTSPDFTVTQSTIDQFAPGFTVDRYVYYNFNTFNWINITTPSNARFDPALPAYQPIYNQSPAYGYPTAIFIGYYVCDPLAPLGSIYGCDGNSPRFGRYQMVEMRPAPAVTFTVAQPPLGFCDDSAPVTLIGSPANSNNITFDNFTANSGQGASVSHAIVATKEVWTLSPASVSGVTAAASQTFDVTYKYTDPVTGCDNTATNQIKVNDRPPVVPASVLSPGAPHSIALCQGTTVGQFTATDPAALPAYTFRWYSDNPTTNLLNTGPTFVPPVDNLTPGTTPFYVTQEANGCESLTPLAMSVVVNPTPAPPTIANTTLEYCINEPIPDIVATGSTIRWYTGLGAFIIADPSPSAAQLGIDNTTAGFYSFYVTQTANGCEGYIPGTATYVTVTIKPLPNVSITADKNISAICTTKGDLIFTAVDLNDGGAAATNGTWSGTGLAGALNPSPLLGTTELDPVALLPGSYNLAYTYENPATNCSNASTVALTILPTVTPSIIVGNVCDGFPAVIINNSTVNQAGGSTTTIDFAAWTLGDGGDVSSGPSASPIPPNTNGGRTTGTFLEPNHIYPNVGTFQISGILTTSDDCPYAIPQQPVTVSPNPVINFAWLSVCRDGTSTTQFHAAETSSPVIAITNYAWNFNFNNTLTVSSSGTGQHPVVNYSSDGTDMVRLIATTAANCKDTIQKPVYIVPSYPPVNENNAYAQNFESGSDGWIAGGTNSSWQLGHPNGSTIKDDADLPLNTGNAWDTNLTGISNTNEQSWVLSRCFDFTQATKPIIAFDIWSDTPTLNDGAVLQYNISGNIENDAHWIVIGNVNQGANWYDATGISSGPGNQAAIPGSNDVGWTGSYPGWRKAAFKLDNLIGQPKVVFRIAFASNLPRRDGFAFDNVFIGERTRTVLFENFTNSSAAANSRNHNEIYNAFSANSPEIAKIQFHTQFPGTDLLNEDNSPINNSRAAFYGITNTAMYTVDGTVVAGPVALLKKYDDRVLTPSPIRITINQVKDGEIVRINTTLRNITSEAIPLDNINIFTTIVEKRIKDPAFLGENQDTVFRFVARKMLPNASGISLSGELAPNQDLNVPEVVWNDAGLLNNNEGAIVVFVQNTEGDNKEVIQAKVVNATVVPDLTTNIVFPEFAEAIRVFPNPANNSLTVQLPEAVNQTIPVNFTDSYGREVISLSIDKGSREQVVSTEELASGLYFINIKSTGGQLVRRKVMIVHKN